MPKSRVQRTVRYLVALGLGAAGCPKNEGDEGDPAAQERAKAAPSEFPGPDDPRFREAHRKALERTRELAGHAFVEAEPLAAHQVGLRESILAPRLSPMTLTEARKQADEAIQESTGIAPAFLDAEDYGALLAVQFGLQRLQRRAKRHPPTRRHPGWVVQPLHDTLDAIELGLATDSCAQCVDAISSVATELEGANHDLGAASLPAMRAATQDVQRLAKRVRQLGERHPEVAGAALASAERFDAVVETMRAQTAALQEAPETAWDAEMGPAAGKAKLRRLPDRMGSRALRSLLEDEEGSAQSPKDVVTTLSSTIARLQAMKDKVAASEGDAPSPVTKPRCEEALKRIEAWAASNDTQAEHGLRCEAIAPLLGTLTDAGLLLELVHLTWIEPRARAHRRDIGSTLALMGGQIAPVSHRHAAAVAATAALDDPRAAREAIDRAHELACQSAATLWVQGQLEAETRLQAVLGDACPQREPEQWIEGALARPLAGLQGVGLAFIEQGPAGAEILARFSWAPLGMIPILASPPEPPPMPKLDITEF